LTGQHAFTGELDLTRLVEELEGRGAVAPDVGVTADNNGQPTSLHISFGVVGSRSGPDAGGIGHGLLRDSVRQAFKYGAIERRRIARRGR
jgi:hypothetical protein